MDSRSNTRFSPRFQRAFERLMIIEGGYVDDPKDRGGATKYGISLRFLAAEGRVDLDKDGFADFDLDMDGDIDGADIRKLTRAHAADLYHRCFWLPVGAEDFPRPLGEAMFDQAVNGGLVAARKLLQQAVNACYRKNPPNGLRPLVVDGVFGPATRAAWQSVIAYPGLGMPALLAAYRQAAADRYRAIVARDPGQKRFLRGWLRRAAELGRGA